MDNASSPSGSDTDFPQAVPNLVYRRLTLADGVDLYDERDRIGSLVVLVPGGGWLPYLERSGGGVGPALSGPALLSAREWANRSSV